MSSAHSTTADNAAPWWPNARDGVPRRVAGCMTGTSLDGIDAALVEISGRGLEIRARFVRGVSRSLGEVAAPLRRLASSEALTASEIASASHAFSLLHLSTIRELLEGGPCDLVCVHGQTVVHAPPISWQLMQAAPIAQALGVPVVHDLRQMDLAAGGQGAPITPIADWIFLRDVPAPWAVVNLGGFCNVTACVSAGPPSTSITAGDLCACNQILDDVARRLLRAPFDDGGAQALSGEVHEEAMIDLDGIIASQSGSRRSLGTGDECAEWVSRWRLRAEPRDLARTACEVIGATIGESLRDRFGDPQRIFLAGGGARNAALVRGIRASSLGDVAMLEQTGLPGAYREAACFAALGALCADRVPITLARVTGARGGQGNGAMPISGAWVLPG